jgi:DNA polymerase II small subunit
MDAPARQEIIHLLLDRCLLASPDLFQHASLTPEHVQSLLQRVSSEHLTVLTKDVYAFFSLPASRNQQLDIDWLAFDDTRVSFEKKRQSKSYHSFLELLQPPSSVPSPPSLPLPLAESKPVLRITHTSPTQQTVDIAPLVTIVRDYDEPSKKRGIKDFVSYYKHRYQFLVSILKQRTELQNVLSLNRVAHKQSGENFSLIGVVYNKVVTRNGHVILTLEDTTGQVKVFIGKDGPLKDLIPYLTFDEVIGVCGSMKNGLFFATHLFFPDIPVDHKAKTTPDEVYAAFISDVHIGSKLFLEKEFLRFIDWLNGNVGSDAQKAMAKKVKYLFVVGDVVDGVGVYPGQESELALPDVIDQYKRTRELLSLIRSDLQIILCPGNHDAVRIAEPQPRVNEFSDSLLGLPNLTLVSNPSLVTIHTTSSFPGVDVLLYHGFSYDYYASTIEPIRTGGAYNRIDLVMKFLLQKRHLAPSHTSTQYIPSTERDTLLIEKIPDIFTSGHIHKSSLGNHHGVLLIGCSCWQSKTSFQEKMGHNPDPGRVPIVNLQTREITTIDFCQEMPS